MESEIPKGSEVPRDRISQKGSQNLGVEGAAESLGNRDLQWPVRGDQGSEYTRQHREDQDCPGSRTQWLVSSKAEQLGWQ